ncbi:MAG: zinc ribbon domain-containing protein, partial [Clostridia bacterium]|nr:zinc ribbon domain-containing protein [Clostridia bacterium]
MHCKHCGKELPENTAFCPACGTKQATTYREVFVRGDLSEQDFLANINKWFQWHPKAVNITGRFYTDTAVGLLANKYALNQFVIEYELSATDNPNQYGIVKEESLAL